jgi:hypothetical protein
MAKEYGINYWDSKNKKTRTRQRYHRTYTAKADAQAEIAGFFCPWEAARTVKVNVAKSKPPKPATKRTILVTVNGGVADVVDASLPSGITVEIIDYDNAEQSGREWFQALSAEAQGFVLADDPDFQLRYEDEEDAQTANS